MRPHTESMVRAMRAAIYGECTDGNWEECKANWMRPDSVLFLRLRLEEQFAKMAKEAREQTQTPQPI